MKKINDFAPYMGILPYASEIFGVYQPMLGWRSKRILGRIEKGFAADISRAFGSLYQRFKGRFEFVLSDDRSLQQIRTLEPATLDTSPGRRTGSFVVDSIARELPPLAEYSDSVWDNAIRADRLKDTLTTVVVPRTIEWYRTTSDQERRGGRLQTDNLNDLVAGGLNRESALAGYLMYLKDHHHVDKLKQFFYKPDNGLARALNLLAFQDPLGMLDPFKDIDRAGLSPVGIVHLFRQYFFEFDTFLGPPVSHVWLSPGSTVELMEISTRKTITERTFESAVETAVKTEKAFTEEDELSDAVKEENKSDTKFGMSTTATQSWVSGSATASASIDMGTTQSKAREQSHRHMRQQTEKLSTEIRKNYKSTFKTVTETTDTSSKRYVLSNTTDKLINYELRRKMRQVGVQVQDIGTYLCWQTYVDDPGRQLGIAKLVHFAKAPEMGTAPSPEDTPMPTPLETEIPISIPFEPTDGDPLLEDDDAYEDGKESDQEFTEETGTNTPEEIRADFDGIEAISPQTGYEYDHVVFDPGGHDVRVSLRNFDVTLGKVRFGIHIDHIHFHGVAPVPITARVTWIPLQSEIDKRKAEHDQKVAAFSEATKYEFQKALVEAQRERINLAGKVEPRKFEDLREEERIVVYRSLIQDMLTKDVPMPDHRTRHVVSELLNTIFDVEKMLYFVAPEYWRPRLHQSHQWLGGIREPGSASSEPAPGGLAKSVYGQLKVEATKNVISSVIQAIEDTQVAPIDTVSWGGTHENRVDNYYITEDSPPAKLGSSLGWLLQLDGDNMRNAFLNAPWVKAVIPIRPGKERAAINWLQRVHVEGTDGIDDQYVASPEQLAEIQHSGPFVTIRDAINHLCDVVAKKHEDSLKVDRYPTDEINDDNRVSAMPIDKVYEHGFYPLQGGFRVMPGAEDFEIFDQWVEVVPTDQVVPVEVAYDPKTGRQI